MIDRTTALLHLRLTAVVALASAGTALGQITSNYDGGCEDAPDLTNDWSCADNWDPDTVPNNGGGDTYDVILDTTDDPFLDIDVTIDSLIAGGTIGDNALLTVDSNDLTVLGGVGLGVGGQYVGSGGSSSAQLSAGAIAITGGMSVPGGGLFMEGTMGAAVLGSVTLSDPGNCTPPDFSVGDDAAMAMEGDFVVIGKADIDYTSSVPMCVGGNFNNRSLDRTIYKFQAGKVVMKGSCLGPGPEPDGAGPGMKLHEFEVAGTDIGPQDPGFIDNFALGELIVSTGQQVFMVDMFDNDEMGQEPCGEALYVNMLTIEPGAQLILQETRIYFREINSEPTAIISVGCGEAIQLPPPTVPTVNEIGLFLLTMSLLVAAGVIIRRRATAT